MIQPIITGKVVDENNKGIADVNVYERNGSGNTRTDANGNFSLKVGSLDGDLQFSHLSYGKETISIYAFNQSKVFEFLPQHETLEEVVIGGSSKKKDHTALYLLLLAGVLVFAYSTRIKKNQPVKVKV